MKRSCLAFTVLFLILSYRPGNCNSEETISIGSILILSGEGSSWGIASKNGIDMAVKKINSEGGINGKKILVDHQDDQGDPKKTISAFKHLVHAKSIKNIIGPSWSNTGQAIQAIAHNEKVLMISPTLGVAGFNESSGFLFNTKLHDFLLTRELAKHVYHDGHRNIALVSAEQVWVEEQTREFKTTFESLGGKIVILEQPNPGTTDVRSIALKIRKGSVDALVSTTNGYVVGSLVARALMQMKAKLPIYSVLLDQAAIDASQGGLEGAEFFTSMTPNAEFLQEYESTFKTPIDIGADSAYDATMLLIDAMKQTNSTDPSVLAEHLNSIKSYEGVSGLLTADSKGGFEKDSALMKVTNGKALRLPPER